MNGIHLYTGGREKGGARIDGWNVFADLIPRRSPDIFPLSLPLFPALSLSLSLFSRLSLR